MRRKITLLILVLASVASQAQFHQKDTFLQSLKAKPEPFLSLNTRNAFYITQPIKIHGLIGGADFNNRVKLYAGVFASKNTQVKQELPIISLDDTIYSSFKSFNVSVGMEYQFFKENRISFSAPVQVGIGKMRYQYVETIVSSTFKEASYTFVPIEAGGNMYFDIFPWIGLKAGLGYRLQLGKVEPLKLSSPYYSAGVWIALGDLFQMVKEKQAATL